MTFRTGTLMAILATLPGVAFAMTTPSLDNINATGVTTLMPNALYSFSYTETAAIGGPRKFSYSFASKGAVGTIAGVSVNLVPLRGITGLYARWMSQGGAVISSWNGGDHIMEMNFLPEETKQLVIGWESSRKGGDVDVNIEAVPLPAGVFLLGTALGALGLARRTSLRGPVSRAA